MANTINAIVSGLRLNQPINERPFKIIAGTPKANKIRKKYVPAIVTKGATA